MSDLPYAEEQGGPFEDRTVELRGKILWLYERILGYDGPPLKEEYCMHGAAGTGKSIGNMFLFYSLCEFVPGISLLVARATRKSLSQSFCIPFERDVCTGQEPFLGPLPETRVRYRWQNGSEIVLFGLDTPEHGYSVEVDGVLVQEAFQVPEPTLDKFSRMTRRYHHPLNFLLLETNPRFKHHPLYKRMERGRSIDLHTKPEDNPKYFFADGTPTPKGVAYRADLERLLGNLGMWLARGEWGGAEGLIYGNWTDEKNIIQAPPMVPGTRMPDWQSLGIHYFVTGVDWGATDPACVQVWGIVESGSNGIPNAMIRVAEWMRTLAGCGQPSIVEWTIERCVEAYHEFKPMRSIVCDPSRNDLIQALNVRLGSVGVPGSRRDEVPKFARAADNSLTRSRHGDMSGLDLVRQLIGENVVNARLKLIEGSVRGYDPTLKERSHPTCFEEEIWGYCYETPEDGKILAPGQGELPAKSVAGKDNALDCARYVANFSFGRNLHRHLEHPRYKPGTMGHMLKDWEIDGPVDIVERQRQKILERQSLLEDPDAKRGWGIPK